jgi:rifampicin phosphotransferase
MISMPIFTQTLFECHDTLLGGGKACNLSRLIRAGFPVPNGFVVTTRAYRLAQQQSSVTGTPVQLPAEAIEEIRQAYRAMGGGLVAVRSSATAEDMAAASMAGQCETYLDIDGELALMDAILHCWASLDAPCVQAYLTEHAIDKYQIAMAVVVQKLVPADIGGVLFTTNPHNGRCREMLIEASWGLGEFLVSGRVQPDVLRLDKETGRVLETTIADKKVYLDPGLHEELLVEESNRLRACLSGRDVHNLWQLGNQVAEYFRSPQDIEWAIHERELYILQSRPITTLQASETYEDVLLETRRHLRQESAAVRGPWVMHNLAETLPHPTPLTWSVIRRFMSGSGGFGAMYRQAGFEPSPTVDREGFLDLIAGRVYMDAARAPEMFFENYPFVYVLEELKCNPNASQSPPTLPRGSLSSRIKVGRRLAVVNAKLRELAVDYDRRLHEVLFPAISQYVADAKQADLRSLSNEQLINCWQDRERQVLDDYGRQLLMPSLISGMALAELRTFLAEKFWEEDPDVLSQMISSGGPPDRTVISNSELFEVAKSIRTVETWLSEHGHRTADEFDLAAPRWRERPEVVGEMAARLAAGESPLDRHHRHCQTVNQRIETLRKQLSKSDRKEFDLRIDLLWRYIAFREDGKDMLMLGYDLLRDVAIEAGCRLDVGEDVFFLTRDDLIDSLQVGYAPYQLIEQRKNTYRSEIDVKLPRVIDEKTIDTLGDSPEIELPNGGHKAFAVSSGESSGIARILSSPTESGELGSGYILICPSTNPSWTPLFINAAGLVLERGGSLSHGAVVARELGLPAVVLPDATQLFRDGEIIHVDGSRGWVCRESAKSHSTTPVHAIDQDDAYISHELIPPPPGKKDRRVNKICIICAIIWAIYLPAFFLLPEKMVYQPTLSAVDLLLWPMVRSLGKPATVAIVAAGMAALTLILQKFITDNRRLLEAKRRAALLNHLARTLPKDSRRRRAMLQIAAPVKFRTLMAAMAPIGILLGLMVMPFIWFKDRIDPAVPHAPAGSAVQVVAMVESDWREPILIDVPKPMVVDETTPISRTLPPLRKTLERLLSLYRQPRNDSSEPWEIKTAPDIAREQTAKDLEAYLEAGIPPQGITWMIRSPESQNGRFPITLRTAGQPPVTAYIVLGDEYPPVSPIARGTTGSPVKELRVVYQKEKIKPVFWQPLSWLERLDYIPFASRLAVLNVSWLMLYIIVYLPSLMLIRVVLKVA